MSTRAYIAGLLAMMTSSVLFGVGAVVVLSVPALTAQAGFWLSVVIVASFLISPVIGWYMAPRLRARYWRRREALRRAREADGNVVSMFFPTPAKRSVAAGTRAPYLHLVN